MILNNRLLVCSIIAMLFAVVAANGFPPRCLIPSPVRERRWPCRDASGDVRSGSNSAAITSRSSVNVCALLR